MKMKQVVTTSHGKIEVRIEGSGPALLVLHGSHMNCDSYLPDEKFLIDLGYKLMIPSRPGYGQTPITTGKTAEQLADALSEMVDAESIEKIDVLAISGGGKTALQLAQRHPDLVRKMILQCTTTKDHWLDKTKFILVHFAFNRWMEKVVWSLIRHGLKTNPEQTILKMMKDLSMLPPERVLNRMTSEDIDGVISILNSSHSGSGFLFDIRHRSGSLEQIVAPTLIIHSRNDNSVDFSHAEYAFSCLQNAKLYESLADSHFIWFGEQHREVRRVMSDFLRGDRSFA